MSWFNGHQSRAGRIGAAFTFASLLLAAAPAAALAGETAGMPGILGAGDAVVTGFSGTLPPPDSLPAGTDPLDYVLINPDGSSMQIQRLLPAGPPAGQLIDAPTLFSAPAREVGQVFAVTLDDAPAPNIYLGATSAFGIHIVAPDEQGAPRHVKQGAPGAQFMPGQWGTDKGGAPGSIYRVDGTTGDISLFSSIGTNAGPGLGDVVFDRASHQFFVSDLDTGLIYRLDQTGLISDTFDHGLTARPLKGLAPVADDGSRMDISKPAFNAEDPATWGLTQPERRVGGMALHGGRLYYAVAEGPQVWSVGINLDGSFRSDPRWELDVASPSGGNPVTDITFDGAGRMIMAQRGAQRGSFDDSVFADPKASSVLRFTREVPDDPATPGSWAPVPEDYAVGFRPDLRNTNGGVALGYAYDAGGLMQNGSCNAFLWTTGEALRDDPALSAQLSAGGPATVDGLQGNDASLVRPANAPPFQSYFTDYDATYDQPERQGWMGDVEIHQPCAGGTQGYLGYPGYAPPPIYFPPGYQPPPTGSFNLTLDKEPTPHVCLPGGMGWLCSYTIRITNTGSVPYWGPLTVSDWMPALAPGTLVSFDLQPPWICGQTGPLDYQCSLPGIFLLPGEGVDLFVTIDQPAGPGGLPGPVGGNLCYAGNSAEILWWDGYGDADPWDDFDYAEAVIPDPDCLPHGDGTNLRIEKHAQLDACFEDAGSWNCPFEITVTNAGPGIYNGPLVVSDEPSFAAPFDYAPKPNPPDWTCVPSGGGNQTCTHAPVTLNPGESVKLWVLLQPGVAEIEQANLCAVRNRVRIIAAPGGSPGNLNGGDDAAEAEIKTPGKNCEPTEGHNSDLSITKTAMQCAYEAGAAGGVEVCGFLVAVKNEGPDAFSGSLTVHDETAPNAGAPVVPPPWVCAASGAGYDCTIDLSGMPLAPGNSVLMPISFLVPMQSQICKLDNVAKIIAPVAGSEANAHDDNDASGAVSLVVPLPTCNPPPEPKSNLKIEKKARGCEVGVATAVTSATDPNGGGNVACVYDVTVTNEGPADIPNVIGFQDEPLLDGTVNLNPNDAGWVCISAGSIAGCSNVDGLAANTSATFTAVVSTTGDAVRQNNCEVGNRVTIQTPLGDPQNTSGLDDWSEAMASAPGQICGQQQLLKQEICPATRQMPDQGCCPEGQRWTGKSCSGSQTTTPTPPAAKLCPPGTKGTYPNCRTITIRVCPSDSVGKYPNCQCKSGTYGEPGSCRERGKVCPQGTHGKWPNCLPNVCPKGTVGQWPDCRERAKVCPQGTHGKWPNCLPNVCPKGTVGQWPDCRERVKVCPQGTHGKWPSCLPNVCPKGTVGQWPDCRERVKVCPQGTHGKWPNCLPNVCPQGSYGEWPNCRTTNTNCPKGYHFSRKKQTCVPDRRETPETQPQTTQPRIPTFKISPELLQEQQQLPK